MNTCAQACTEDSDWGKSVSAITHTKEENLKSIRNVNGSTLLLHPPSPIRGPCRNCVSFCGLGPPKGSSKRFPCHRVQDSNIYISCSLGKACSSVWDLQVWAQLPKPAVRVAVPACSLGSQWLVSQGMCYRASVASLTKEVVMSVPVMVWRYRYHHWGALWGVSSFSSILASVWGDLNVPPMKVCLSHEQAVHGVPGPDFPTSEVVLLCW